MARTPFAARQKRLAAALRLNLKRRKSGTGSASKAQRCASPAKAERAGSQDDDTKPTGDPPSKAPV